MATYFTSATFDFLRQLAAHNERDWFHANKQRYLSDVQEPALSFISDFAPRLAKISSHLTADPRAAGGSLFRIYRDTRFSKDKTPYKTHVGMRFGHEAGYGVHAPGLYLHIEPGANYAGIGLWRPETAMARRLRQAIVDDPTGWRRAAYGRNFLSTWTPDGDSLTRPPQGFDPSHPYLHDLKRKDFIAGAHLEDEHVTSASFMTNYAAMCKIAVPYMRFLTEAVGLPF